ncbi:hypothetical protein CRUP_008761 [Coryphaenoides rupestris]|nr:hypothetical protein CRUP_008761 [Coryphaenoides rupestris]
MDVLVLRASVCLFVLLLGRCEECGVDSCYDDVNVEMPSGSKRLFNYTDDAGRSRLVVQWNYTQATRWDLVPMCSVYIAPHYWCEAQLDLGPQGPQPPPVMRSLKLNDMVYFKPEILASQPGPIVITEGETLLLNCTAYSNPSPNLTVTFYRGGATLGEYWCEAQLDLGPQGPQPPPVMRSLKLNDMVYFKPEILASQPGPIVITEGETLLLNCTAYSNPSPVYSWRCPDNSTVSNHSVLTIHSAGFNHEGQYVCVTSNNQGSASMEFYVDVSVDFVPIVAGLGALVLLFIIAGAGFVFKTHYRYTRMGQYEVAEARRGNVGSRIAVDSNRINIEMTRDAIPGMK